MLDRETLELAHVLFPELADARDFEALLALAVATVRGLAIARHCCTPAASATGSSGRRLPVAASRAAVARRYGVVVDSVKVSVLL